MDSPGAAARRRGTSRSCSLIRMPTAVHPHHDRPQVRLILPPGAGREQAGRRRGAARAGSRGALSPKVTARHVPHGGESAVAAGGRRIRPSRRADQRRGRMFIVEAVGGAGRVTAAPGGDPPSAVEERPAPMSEGEPASPELRSRQSTADGRRVNRRTAISHARSRHRPKTSVRTPLTSWVQNLRGWWSPPVKPAGVRRPRRASALRRTKRQGAVAGRRSAGPIAAPTKYPTRAKDVRVRCGHSFNQASSSPAIGDPQTPRPLVTKARRPRGGHAGHQVDVRSHYAHRPGGARVQDSRRVALGPPDERTRSYFSRMGVRPPAPT